jgi:hypothetical protein
MMTNVVTIAFFLLSLATLATPFGVVHKMAATPLTLQQQHHHQRPTSTSAILMAKQDEDLLRFARQSRTAQSDDNVVELMRPLGLVLNQDDNGNVYVETVAPRGNAARTGKVMNKTFKHGLNGTFETNICNPLTNQEEFLCLLSPNS